MKKKWLILTSVFLIFCGCQSSELEDPSTTIPFSIAEESHVKLYVNNSYDVTVAILKDEDLQSGLYFIPFDLPDLAEGLYFSVLEVTGKTSGKTTILKRTILLSKKP